MPLLVFYRTDVAQVRMSSSLVIEYFHVFEVEQKPYSLKAKVGDQRISMYFARDATKSLLVVVRSLEIVCAVGFFSTHF